MQDFAWDPLKDEIFMTQNIRTSNGRQTIKINKLGKADHQGVRHFISSMTLTDAGHGDVLGPGARGTCPGTVHLLTRASRYRRLASADGSLVSTLGSASLCRAAPR